MRSPGGPTSRPSQLHGPKRPATTEMFVLVALGFVAGVVLAAVTGYFDLMYSNQTAAYDAAAVCSSPGDISPCRFRGDGTIARKYTDDNGALKVDVRFDQLGGRTVTGYISTSYSGRWQSWRQGDGASAELWMGRLTTIDNVPTRGNPDALPNAGVLPVIVFGGASGVMVVAFIWLRNLNRRAGF